MLKAVQIGAGNIGRGFLGQIYHESGCRTTFVDTNDRIVDLLERRGQYPLRLIGPTDDDPRRDLTISNVAAVHALKSRESAVAAIAEADIVGTSVGVGALAHIAPLLAAGINARCRAGGEPLNILLCENQQHCSQVIRELLEPHVAPTAVPYFRSRVGLVETVIGRMVPAPTAALTAEDPLLVAAEPYLELPVAASMVRGHLPPLVSVVAADVFESYEAQKLFMHNAGHAALAYIGYLRGYTYIWECVRDTRIRAVCEEALRQVGSAILRAFPGAAGMDAVSLDRYTEGLLTRFENKALGDTVSRVAADPIRKLRPNDRLIGAVNFCEANDTPHDAFAAIVAAALQFDRAEDPSAVKLQEMRRSQGDSATLGALCGLSNDSLFKQAVLRHAQRGC